LPVRQAGDALPLGTIATSPAGFDREERIESRREVSAKQKSAPEEAEVSTGIGVSAACTRM
jgi:hypothetical protein